MSTPTDEAIQYVLHSAHEHDVKFVRLWFTDILGNLRGFAITVDELEHVLHLGATFDGSSIEGLPRPGESDMVAVPDPSTWQILPWRPRPKSVARMFCDLHTPDGQPAQTDSRQILRRNLQRAADMGFAYYVAPEVEYFYLKDRESAEPLDEAVFFDQTTADAGLDLRRDTVLALEEMGIPVHHSHHERSPGQQEIYLRHMDALAMADAVVTYRVVVKEIAAQQQVYATFMPKPFDNLHGSGMHTHLSLFRGDENAFFDSEDPLHLSSIGNQFMAGLLRHANEITVVTNQWVNSYKRLVPGFEAPVVASWAHGDWGGLVRVPAYKPGREASVRIEYRVPDSACNPYLAFSVILAAGLEGIEKGYALPEAVSGDLDQMPEAELERRGVRRLPRTLGDALRLAERSELLEKALGPQILESFMRSKQLEWHDYSGAVTDYEVDRYLTQL